MYAHIYIYATLRPTHTHVGHSITAAPEWRKKVYAHMNTHIYIPTPMHTHTRFSHSIAATAERRKSD